MAYVGEHPLPGQIGHFFTVLAFVSAIFTSVVYYLNTRTPEIDKANALKRWGRLGFTVHTASVLGIVITLFYMFVNHLYEYEYVHSHSNREMPAQFILTAFWGGQQGSLILWSFFHVVLGNVLMRTAGKWEAPTMSIFSLVQVFVSSTLLGVYILGYKIGESPFALYRETENAVAELWTLIPDYMKVDDLFSNGTGLNLTLQNYWYMIHPPVLFIGFASVLVPFVFAVAGLWKNDLKGWVTPALPWVFFSVGILGTGILMGGAWAYESLNFGGFWAWDPVENASLVPWLVLVGGAHVMLISKNRNRVSYAAFILIMLSFILILYSTFLTRSGVLGSSSVHSFTGDGMLNQLLFFLLVFIWLPFHFLIIHKRTQYIFLAYAALLFAVGSVVDYNTVIYSSGDLNIGWRGILFVAAFLGCYVFLYLGYSKSFPREKNKEADPVWSREFWMFVGALLLLLSSVHIIVSTSMPVLNDILGTNFAPVADEERNRYYAEYQVPFAIAITLLMSAGMYMRYKGMSFKQLAMRLGIPFAIAAALTFFTVKIYAFTNEDIPLIALMFTSLAVITANLEYWFRFMKGRLSGSGAALAHVGFGLMMVGTVISQGKQEVISENRDGRDIRFVNKEFNVFQEAQVYYGDTTLVGNYFISFNNKYQEANKIYYGLDFFQAEPVTYQPGDTLRFASGLITPNQEHVASAEFTSDFKAGKWNSLIDTTRAFYKVPAWKPLQPGKKLFSLLPHVQLNPEGASGSNEPGTKRYWNRDVFIYLRDAKLTMDEPGYHRPYAFKRPFNLNDTIRIPHYFIIPDSIYPITKGKDIYRLLDKDSVWAIRFKVHPLLYDKMMSQFVYGEALYIQRDSMHLPDMQEVPQLGLRIGLNSMKIKLSDSLSIHPTEAEFDVVVQDREYVVMKAIEFPMINLLWSGSIIMCLGTIMSVIQRIRNRKKEKKT